MHTINPVYTSGPYDTEMGVTNQIVVRFLTTTDQNAIDEINTTYGVKIITITSTYSLLSIPDKANALDIANAYQESNLVKFAHPDFISPLILTSYPNDTYFNKQWGLHNTGQIINDGHSGTADADVDALEAWDITLGDESIVIAIIDQGVTDNHPDLPSTRQVRLPGSNFANLADPDNPSPVGTQNHGNACAGIAAATQNNEGVSGICPSCKI